MPSPKWPPTVPGSRYGKLTALEKVGIVSPLNRSMRWRFICDCGSETITLAHSVRQGRTKSCGCLIFEGTHGKTGTSEYRAWDAMKRRCRNQNHHDYQNYGGRGITVCDRWVDDFEAFLTDVGLRPSAKHSLDRIDNDGNYEPGNCRWATMKAQANNQRRNRMVEFRGRMVTLQQACDDAGIPHRRVRHRLTEGWDVQAALAMPKSRGGRGHPARSSSDL